MRPETITINGVEHGVRRCATSIKNLPLLFHATNSSLINGTDVESIDDLLSIKNDVELWARGR